jgi:anti-anti-sigma factor
MVRMKQDFLSDLRQLAEMRAFVREGCRQAWGLAGNHDTLHKLDLAVTEAATNIIRHAYRGEAGRPIEIVFEADDDQLCIGLFHEGLHFDPEEAPEPAFDGSREGGFGLYLIRETVDEARYFRDERGRSGLHLIKKRPSTEERRRMEPVVEVFGDVAVVEVNVEQLDASNEDEFRRDMAPVLKEYHKVVLDLGRVQFIDSRGCGAILSCLKQVSTEGGDLKLCQVTPPARTVFELIRLHKICEILPSRAEAVRAFASAEGK